MDASGNAYVVGITTATTGAQARNYIIIKLNSSGSQQWVKTYDRGVNKDDEAMAIDVDASGNVYVTGRSKNSGNFFDIVTLKLNGGTGNQVWSHVFTGSGLDNVGTGIVVSPNGSYVYVTGNTNNSLTGSNIVTYALNAGTGTAYWSGPVTSNGSANGSDKSSKIIMQGSDVIICGEKSNSTSGLDFCTIKYTGATGSIIWDKSYDYGNTTNRATSLTKDSTGNVGVVGTVLNGSLFEYHTVLYTTSGIQYAVNIESTGLAVLSADPTICNDTIAHHWYVAGQKQKITNDIFVYQISPSGNTAWKTYVDGQNDVDAATGIAVNGVGVVYVAGMSKNSTTNFDYMTIKLNQTPVYFPPDITSFEAPSVRNIFYENKGQIINKGTSTVATDILFATMDEYPNIYFKKDRFNYKLHRRDTIHSGMDTTQRIEVSMVGSNALATAYQYEPVQGLMNFMDAGLPNNVFDVQGYQRLFIPNIYPYIDLHYYSNSNGLKMYYVVKPGANPAAINWRIQGATSTTINASSELKIKGFNATINFARPKVYTVNWSGAAVPLTSTVLPTWNSSGGNYGITVPTYSLGWPLIIELDYGSVSAASGISSGNLDYMSFYGGSLDEGFKSIKVDKSNGEYVCLGTTESYDQYKTFPVDFGTAVTSTVSSSGQSGYLGIAYFNTNGSRKSGNIYGIPGIDMQPLDVIVNKNLITVIGNVAKLNSAFPPNNSAFLTSGTYTNVNGPGYLVQFELYPNGQYWSLNHVKWFTRANGYFSGIAMKPDSKEIYVTSSINTSSFTPDLMTKTGALNLTSVTGTWNGQVSKFDSTGVRKWSSLLQIGSNNIGTNLDSRYANGISTNTKGDYYRKLRISCDNFGFAIAGDLDTNKLSCPNKYGATITNTFSGHYDAFVGRFNSKDSIVVARYIGGSSDDVLNDVKITGPNEITVVGYSSSQEYKKLTKYNVGQYIDTTVNTGCRKVLINKFDTLGNRTWGTLFGGSALQQSNGWSITKDNLNKLYITGRTYGLNLASINSGSVYSQLSTLGDVDSYVLSFDNSNNLIWNTYYGGSYAEGALALDYNPFGNRIMTAGTTSTPAKNYTMAANYFPAKQPNAPYTSAYFTDAINSSGGFSSFYIGPYDGYLGWFYTAVPVGIKEYFMDKTHSVEDLIQIFPNPTNDKFYVTLDKTYNKNVKINVYNQLGQLEYSEMIPNAFEKTIVPLNSYNMKNGVYIVTVSDDTKSTSKKLIIAGK